MAEVSEVSDYRYDMMEEEGSWVYARPDALLSVDKPVVVADGVDMVTVTARVRPGLELISFYVDGQYVGERPVVAGYATLEVLSDVPGQIRVRAGDDCRYPVNEVIINAKS